MFLSTFSVIYSLFSVCYWFLFICCMYIGNWSSFGRCLVKCQKKILLQALEQKLQETILRPISIYLFWRVCNSTSQFTFRKAMDRLKEAGGDKVMTWFAKLGYPCTWSKHAFDPNVCNDFNTSNFVESFNSTLGVYRCRPVLTLLECIPISLYICLNSSYIHI